MLSPVSSVLINSPAPAPRDVPAATQTPTAVLTTADAAVALSMAANSEVEGKLNMLLIGARERMIDSLLAVIDAVSQSLNMQQAPDETNIDFAQRLATTLNELDTELAPVIQQQLTAQGQTAPLALVARALQNPAGTEAAQVVAYMEVVRYKEKDLATQAVVASYGQNSAEEPEPAKASGTPVQAQGQAPPATAEESAAATQPLPSTAGQTAAQAAALPQAPLEEPATPQNASTQPASPPSSQAATVAATSAPASSASSSPTPQAAVHPAATSLPEEAVTPLPSLSAQPPAELPRQSAAIAQPVAEEQLRAPVSDAADEQPAARTATAAPATTIPAAPPAEIVTPAQTGQASQAAAPRPAGEQASPVQVPRAASDSSAQPMAKAGNTQPAATPVPNVEVPVVDNQLPKDVQTALKVVVAQLANATGAELLQTLAEAAPEADRIVAQALVADMLDSAELGTLPSPDEDVQQGRSVLQQSAAGSSAQSQAASASSSHTEDLASVVALNRLLAEAAPATSMPAQQALPLQAQLPLGVPFAVGQYLPAEDAMDENEALHVDRVDAVDDGEDEGSSSKGGRRQARDDEAAEEQPEAGHFAAHEDPAEDVQEEDASTQAPIRQLALPRPAPVEPFRQPVFDLYQRMGGWD